MVYIYYRSRCLSTIPCRHLFSRENGQRSLETRQKRRHRTERDDRQRQRNDRGATRNVTAHRSPTVYPIINFKMDGDFLRTLPDHVLTTKVFTYFGFKDYALTGCACRYSQAHWQLENERKPMPLYVPVDCRTLQEAVKRVTHDPRITTIVVGKGEHQIDGTYLKLKINSAMNIVGDPGVPKSEIVVVGGILFEGGIPGNSHLQHLTLRQAKRNGVFGESSFTMEDVLVEQCTYYGVRAYGAGVVGRCTNVEVRQCGGSGVTAGSGASITLIGAKTTVHHNCTIGDSDTYGLKVYGSSSTILLVAPLTKEQVSIDNGGGGNWGVVDGGDINKIETIGAPAISSSSSAQAGETKSTH